MKIKKIKVGKHDKEAIENLIWFYDCLKRQKKEEKKFNSRRKN